MWGGVQAALCCLRFFTDDRGRTHGRARIGQRPRRRSFKPAVRPVPGDLRAVSAPASSSSTTFRRHGSACIPTRGRKTHMKRSYFNPGICGDGTDMPCPIPICRCRPSTPATSTRRRTRTPRGVRGAARSFPSNRAGEGQGIFTADTYISTIAWYRSTSSRWLPSSTASVVAMMMWANVAAGINRVAPRFSTPSTM